MNLKILPTYSMVAITEEWFANPLLAAEIKRHPLGAPLWSELGNAHTVVLGRQRQRMAIEARLAVLGKLSSKHGERHARKARVLRTLLLGLAEGTDDTERAELYLQLDALLFPHQLRILNMSYLEAAGAAVELEQRVTPDILRTLESICAGDQCLADLYRAWVQAGKELGRCVHERARLEASLGQGGSTTANTSSRKVRSGWIRAVRLLLDALDLLGLGAAAHEALLAPLRKAIQDARLRRASSQEPMSPPVADDPGGDPGGDPEPGDDLADLAVRALDVVLAAPRDATPGQPQRDALTLAPSPSTHRPFPRPAAPPGHLPPAPD